MSLFFFFITCYNIDVRKEVGVYMAYIMFKDVKKEYQVGDVVISALRNVCFSVDKGEFVVVLGPSGAGKTTLLNLLGGMDVCSSGSIVVDGKDITKLDRKSIISYRRNDIGFVFQFYNLIQNLTALENVELASQICKNPLDSFSVLKDVGLADRASNFPSQLSGGEQQRVAIARAIAKNPKILLCDEPTGALDSKTGKKILSLLQYVCREYHITVILITHDAMISKIADKIVYVRNGQIDEVVIQEKPSLVEEIVW